MGYSVPDNPQSVGLMKAGEWEKLASEQWPGLEIASQDEVYERLAENRVILGPFGGFSD